MAAHAQDEGGHGGVGGRGMAVGRDGEVVRRRWEGRRVWIRWEIWRWGLWGVIVDRGW